MLGLLGDLDLVGIDLDARHLGTPASKCAGELAVAGPDIDDGKAPKVDQQRQMVKMVHAAHTFFSPPWTTDSLGIRMDQRTA